MSRSPESASRAFESQLAKENQYSWTIGGIIVSGGRGTGKTHLLRTLHTRYDMQSVDVGGNIRKQVLEKTGVPLGGTRERDFESDILADLGQWELFTHADTNNPFLITSWLGAFFATNMENSGMLSVPVKKILLYTDPVAVGDERAARRDAKNKNITIEQALKDNEERFQKDWSQWVSLYKTLADLDLYKPGLMDKNGRPFYDLEINVTNLGKDEPAEAVNTWLLTNDYIKPL